MSSSTVHSFLEAAAAGIRADDRVPHSPDVVVWRGRIGGEVLDLLSTKDPAIVVSCDRANPDLTIDPLTLNLTIVVLCMSRGGQDREDVALALSEGVMRWLYGWVWGSSFKARPPDGLTARNIWTPSIDKKGAALWAVAWNQLLEIPDPAGAEEPWVPEALFIDDEDSPETPGDLAPAGAPS